MKYLILLCLFSTPVFGMTLKDKISFEICVGNAQTLKQANKCNERFNVYELDQSEWEAFKGTRQKESQEK